MADDFREQIILSVGLDGSGVTEEAENIKKKLKEVGDVPVDKSIKGLKQQLKEAREEAIKLQLAGKIDTKEYQNAVNTLARLKDEQDILNRSVAAFDPGNRLQAFVQVGRLATTAVQGIAGSMAAFGVETDKAFQTLAQLQGILALKDTFDDISDFMKAYSLRVGEATGKQAGLVTVLQSTAVYQAINNGLNTAATAIMAAFGISVDATSLSFKVLKGAIAATGIGLLVIAIVELIQNFDKLKEALTGTSKAQQAFKETTEEAHKAAQEAIGKTIQSVDEVRNAFALAEKGTISKRQALDKYNETLGDAFGRTTDLATAEKNLGDKADAYIKMTILKAEATVFFQKAADAASKGLTANLEDQTNFGSKLVASLKSYFGDAKGATETLIDSQAEGVKKVQAQSNSIQAVLENQGQKLLQTATNIGNQNKIKSQDQADLQKRLAQERVDQINNEIKVAEAAGKSTYKLEIEKWGAMLGTAVKGSQEYKNIEADRQAFIKGYAKTQADNLRDERKQLKDHLTEMQKVVDDAKKQERDAKLDDRRKELNDIEAGYQEQLKASRKSNQDFILDIRKQVREHRISVEEGNKSINDVNAKQKDVEEALKIQKREQDIATEKKYNKIIADFINEYNDSEYQKNRQKLIEDFDEKIKIADDKQKILLQKLKTDQVNKLDREENLKKNVVTTQTNVVENQTANTLSNYINEDVRPGEQAKRVEEINRIELEAQQKAYEKKKTQAAGNQDALEQIERDNTDRLAQIEQDRQDRLTLIRNGGLTLEDKQTQLQDEYDLEAEQREAQFQLELDQLGSDEKAKKQLRDKYKQDELNAETKLAADKRKLALDERKMKEGVYKDIGTAAVALGDIVGKQTVAAKALNAANALMNTYLGITEVWKAESVLPQPFDTISRVANTIIVAKSGFDAVKGIMTTQLPNGGGGGGVTAPSVDSVTAPVIQAIQTSASNAQIQDVRVTNPNSQVIRAYITDRDLVSQQQKSNFLDKLSSF